MFYSVIKSRFSHPISSAIFANVCRSGWCMLVRANIIKVGYITKRILKKLHLPAFLVPSTSLDLSVEPAHARQSRS